MPPIVFDPNEWTPIEAPSATAAEPIIFDPAEWTPARSLGEKVYDWAGSAADMGTFGLGDELTATAKGVGSLIRGNDLNTARQAAQDELARQRVDLAAYQQAHPYESIASGIIGSLPITVGLSYLTGGASLPATGAKIIPLAQQLKHAAKVGSIWGGLYGAGSAESAPDATLAQAALDRAKGSAKGAAVGAATGPVVQAIGFGAGKGLGAVANTEAARNMYSVGKHYLSDEAGALGDQALPALTPAEQFIKNKLASVPVEQVKTGQSELAAALAADQPVFMAEAVNSPRLARAARFNANFEPSMDAAQGAIRARQNAAPTRIAAMLDDVFPENETLSNAQRFTTGANQIVEDAKLKRSMLAGPLYEDAARLAPEIETEAAQAVIQTTTVQKAITELRAEFPERYGNLPDNSFRMLDAVKKKLDGAVAGYSKNGQNFEAGLVANIRDSVKDAVDTATPEYQAARDMFARASDLVDNLEGGKWGKQQTYGLLENLMGGDPEKAVKATKTLMNMQPETIRKIRGLFGTKYADQWRAGIRAYLQDTLEGVRSGRDIVGQILEPELNARRLRAALGSETFHELETKLTRESIMHEAGSRLYHEGSSTAGNLAEYSSASPLATALMTGVEAVGAPRTAALRAARGIGNMFSAPDPQLARDVSPLLFDSLAGRQALERIIPYLEREQALGATVDRGTSAFVRYGAMPSVLRALLEPGVK
jgi:hypothetical protein